VAEQLGTPFMPWQRMVADVALEVDRDTGRLAYREVDLLVPRQSGKTTMVLSVVLNRALGAPGQNIVYGAQTQKDGRNKWEDDWLPILDKSRFSRFYRKRLANGHEGLVFANGSMQGLLANTEQSGHGGTIDLGFDDESFARKDSRREQAILPAMITRPQPQWWVVSTVGTPSKSPYLYGKAVAGRKLAVLQADDVGRRKGTCYVEFSAPDDADPYDPKTWWDCMPALGYTVVEDAVRAAMDTMLADPKLGLNEFRRAYLNQWVLAMGDPIVPLDHWHSLARVDAPRPPWVVLGLAVAPRDEYASVVAAGVSDTGEDLVGIQSTVVEHGEGVDWLLPQDGAPGALAALVERYDRPYVVVDEKQCAHLMPEIEAVCGFDRVRKIRASDVGPACAFWLRLAQTSKLGHRDEAELTVALAAAERRVIGDGWAFSQTRSGGDVTPLLAQVAACSFWLGAWGSDDD